MKELRPIDYKCFEDIKHKREDGSEYWSARELAVALSYEKWQNFESVIKRAMIACDNSGHTVNHEFTEVSNFVTNSRIPKRSMIMNCQYTLAI